MSAILLSSAFNKGVTAVQTSKTAFGLRGPLLPLVAVEASEELLAGENVMGVGVAVGTFLVCVEVGKKRSVIFQFLF